MDQPQAFDLVLWQQRREATRQRARVLIASLSDAEKKLMGEWPLHPVELSSADTGGEEPVNTLLAAANQAVEHSQEVKARIRELEVAEVAERQRLAEQQRREAERDALAKARAKAMQTRMIVVAVVVVIVIGIVIALNSR